MSELVTTTERVAAERNQPLAAVEVHRDRAPAVRGNGPSKPFCAGGLALAALAGGLAFGFGPRLRRERELLAAAAEVSAPKPRITVVTARAATPTAERVLPGSSQPLLEAAIYAR